MSRNPVPIQPAPGHQPSPIHIVSRHEISPNSLYQPIACPPPRTKKRHHPHHFPRQRPRRHNPDYSSDSDSEKLELEPEDQQLPDSGYGTQSSLQSVDSLDSHPPKSLLSALLNNKPSKPSDIKSSPLPGRDDILIFRGTGMEPSFQAVSRFREIMPEIQRVLQKHVASSQKWSSLLPSGMRRKKRDGEEVVLTMRLMMVGKTAETARPSIVIFVSTDQTAGLEGVMRERGVRELYCPGDGFVTNFEVVIVGEAAKKRFLQMVEVTWEGGSALSVNDKGLPTWCGEGIRLGTAGGKSVASTIGGLVKLTNHDGEVQIVGMTAAHALEGLLDDDDGSDSEGDETEEEPPQQPQPQKPLLGQLIHPSLPINTCSSDLKIPPRDWALFEITKSNLKPNLRLQSSARSHFKARADELALAEPSTFPDMASIEVELLSQTGVKHGSLSHLPAGLMLSPDHGFVQAYTLTLDETYQVDNGDSGAWVINPISKTVYGHLVSTDCTGDGYVIPLHSTLSEITATIPGLASVCLAAMADLVEHSLRSYSWYLDSAVAGSARAEPGSAISETPAWAMALADCAERERGKEMKLDGVVRGAYERDVSAGDRLRVGKGQGRLLSDRDSGYGSCGSSVICNLEGDGDGEVEGGMADFRGW
ncbi:uncharacterized protein PODANS_4_5980 [Podospora anserina S mat+]|uniref:Podospora anserina S mat+ genomic DNA chromosome 4, supercontig 4 n=1 Tax=Podospora anserina (strain S / ATCC MYA-4624 / DSM 980 / FGSC 10383) TaxID=515849 RepID=B2APX3_PODAN|nr:uncharacterized protein PODANS_4_5980 [Podospora anserina S mat+]CAP66912.1 unnamed protein product [Podospora anserina S mat+]CDP28654.1 Putative protein of unknown function [Podospora anserina S mat+]